jgi:hypothetical protein
VACRACRVATVRIEESAEDRSEDGAEERADEAAGLPWAKVEGHRAGVRFGKSPAYRPRPSMRSIGRADLFSGFDSS